MFSAVAVIGVLAVLVVIGVAVLAFRTREDINLTPQSSEKPDWVRHLPPPETLAASQQDGDVFQIFDHDEGERVAAPFAEQIEDILRAELAKDPHLQALHVDLGTAPDGSLEIWLGKEKFTDIQSLPDARLRAAFAEAVRRWQEHEG